MFVCLKGFEQLLCIITIIIIGLFVGLSGLFTIKICKNTWCCIISFALFCFSAYAETKDWRFCFVMFLYKGMFSIVFALLFVSICLTLGMCGCVGAVKSASKVFVYIYKSELDNRNSSRKQWSQVGEFMCLCYKWVWLVKNCLFCLCGFDSHYCIGKNIYFLLLCLHSAFFARTKQLDSSISLAWVYLFLLLVVVVVACTCLSVCLCVRSIVVGCSVCLVSLLIYYGRIWVALSYYFLHFSACPMYVVVVVVVYVFVC